MQSKLCMYSILSPYRLIQSVEATGGVYNQQGRIQHKLMTYAYKIFLVQER